jgi:hypothetical protein
MNVAIDRQFHFFSTVCCKKNIDEGRALRLELCNVLFGDDMATVVENVVMNEIS